MNWSKLNRYHGVIAVLSAVIGALGLVVAITSSQPRESRTFIVEENGLASSSLVAAVPSLEAENSQLPESPETIEASDESTDGPTEQPGDPRPRVSTEEPQNLVVLTEGAPHFINELGTVASVTFSTPYGGFATLRLLPDGFAPTVESIHGAGGRLRFDSRKGPRYLKVVDLDPGAKRLTFRIESLSQ